MNETTRSQKPVFDAVERTLDHASRYWRPAYDTLSEDEVSTIRRDKAIGFVVSTLADHYAPDGTYIAPSMHELAELIVESSYIAWFGYDALNVTPTRPWWRFWGGQNPSSVVTSDCV